LDKATTFNTEILGATWDDELLLWRLETKDLKTGVSKTWTANMLISAAGQFSVPKIPDITGIDQFKGEKWHTVDWPKNASFKGKTVGVIGTGPSAAQVIPHIYKEVAKMVIYQRSPSYCLPREDFVAGPLRKWLFAHIPFARRIYTWWLTKMAEFLAVRVFVPGTWWQKKAIELAHGHVDRVVKDPVIAQKLKPKDNFGCKRPLLLDDYYPLFNQPNVELVTDPVTGLTEHGILSKNAETGKLDERKVDVLIWGTGYKPDEFGLAVPTRGRKGQLISEKYQPEMFSLYGLAVDDFPNYFNFLGPNSLSFEASVVKEMELQAEYITQAAKYLYKKNVGSFRYALMPKEERLRTWTLSLREGQAKHPAAVASCQSYYKSRDGQVYFWPYKWSNYVALIKKINFDRDWVLLTGRPGQSKATVTSFA